MHLLQDHICTNAADAGRVCSLSPLAVFLVYLASAVNPHGVVLSALPVTAPYLVVTIWMLVLYYWFGRVLLRHHASVVALAMMIALRYNGAVAIERRDLCAYVPLVKHARYARFEHRAAAAHHVLPGTGHLLVALSIGLPAVTVARYRPPGMLAWSCY